MKILLVCAGGMSTGILMKKMKTYWAEQNVELEITAVGLSEYEELHKDYEIILVGPQIGYCLKQIIDNTGLPAAVIPSFDYAVGNCANIMLLAKKLYEQE